MPMPEQKERQIDAARVPATRQGALRPQTALTA
jgi:hypothetical protein